MLEAHLTGETTPADVQAFRRIDAATLENECGVRPGRGENVMKHVPRPLLKGWREGVHWKVVEDDVYLSGALFSRLRERIQAVQAVQSAGVKRGVEQVTDSCRRRELQEDKRAQERERIRLARASGEYVRPLQPRRRDGAIYVPVKDRS